MENTNGRDDYPRWEIDTEESTIWITMERNGERIFYLMPVYSIDHKTPVISRDTLVKIAERIANSLNARRNR